MGETRGLYGVAAAALGPEGTFDGNNLSLVGGRPDRESGVGSRIGRPASTGAADDVCGCPGFCIRAESSALARKSPCGSSREDCKGVVAGPRRSALGPLGGRKELDSAGISDLDEGGLIGVFSLGVAAGVVMGAEGGGP